MKSRKVLEITFRDGFGNTMFRWDGNTRGYKATDGADRRVLLVEVQRRGDRSEMARKARWIYGATTRTLIVG